MLNIPNSVVWTARVCIVGLVVVCARSGRRCMVQTNIGYSFRQELTGAIRDQPGFDSGMAVRKTKLLLPKRLRQAIIQFQNAADA